MIVYLLNGIFVWQRAELNLYIVFSEGEDDFCDVSGSLSLQLFAHIQHCPAIVLFSDRSAIQPTQKC